MTEKKFQKGDRVIYDGKPATVCVTEPRNDLDLLIRFDDRDAGWRVGPRERGEYYGVEAGGGYWFVAFDDEDLKPAPVSAEVQSAAPVETHASPLSEAVLLLRKGKRLPRTLITALLDEGHDITGLIRSVQPASL